MRKLTDILDAFSLAHPELRMAQIRQASGLPASTVQRLVGNLVASDFLDRTHDRCRVGRKMAYWEAPAAQGVDTVEALRPVMPGLRDETGETVCLSTTSRTYRICIAMSETRHQLHTAMRVGRIIPLHIGSADRVLLAWNPALAERVIAVALEAMADGTITDAGILRENFSQCRLDGFAITIGERESGATGLCAPVFNTRAEIEGALTVMGPTLCMSRGFCESSVEPLLNATEVATRLIGGRTPGAVG